MQKNNKVEAKRGCKKWSLKARRRIRAVIARITIIAITVAFSPTVVYAKDAENASVEQQLERLEGYTGEVLTEQLQEQKQEVQEMVEQLVELLEQRQEAEVELQPTTIWEAIEMLPPEKVQMIRIVGRVIHCEAGITYNADELYRVGTVFMSRVERKDFPSNINTLLKWGYISYKNQYWNTHELTTMEIEIAYDIVVNHARVFDNQVVYQATSVQKYLEKDGKIVYQSAWHQYGTKTYNEEAYDEEDKQINVWEVYLPQDKF